MRLSLPDFASQYSDKQLWMVEEVFRCMKSLLDTLGTPAENLLRPNAFRFARL